MKLNYYLIAALLLAGLLIAPVSAAVGDKILFEQVNISKNITQIWNNGSFRVYPVIQGVTSTDNIDQTQTSGVTVVGVGNASGLQYIQAGNFTPTKSQLTGVTLYKNTSSGSPLSNMVVEIRTAGSAAHLPSSTIIASKSIPNTTWATYSNGAVFVELPAIVTSGSQYWIVLHTALAEPTNTYYVVDSEPAIPQRSYSTDGGSIWTSFNSAFHYLSHYAKNTESTNITVNGQTLMLDTGDATGLLSGATVDTYRGFYNWTWGKVSDVYAASNGGRSTGDSVIHALNNWYFADGNEFDSAGDGVPRNITFKINTILPVKEVTFVTSMYSAAAVTQVFQVSTDNSSWTTIASVNGGGGGRYENTSTTVLLDGNNIFYARFSKPSGVSDYAAYKLLSINATLNTTTSNATVLTYQTGTNIINITSYGNVVSSSLDPSLQANVSLIEGASLNSITANFTISNTSGIEPLLTHFTDTSTTNEATIDAWYWDFGDGTTSTEQDPPDHTYQNGTYDVNLTITNTSLSLVSTKIQTVTVYKLPNADFSSFNTQGTAPFTTYLYDTSTNLNPGPYTYYWDLGDGNTSTSQNLYYTWNITGTYEVKHSVSDSITTAWKNVTGYVTVGTPTPPVVAPVASFYGGPQTGNVPLTVFFTDVSSNSPTSWNWSFGDGVYSELQNPSHTYNRSGFRTVNLTATNSAGSNITVRSKFVRVS